MIFSGDVTELVKKRKLSILTWCFSCDPEGCVPYCLTKSDLVDPIEKPPKNIGFCCCDETNHKNSNSIPNQLCRSNKQAIIFFFKWTNNNDKNYFTMMTNIYRIWISLIMTICHSLAFSKNLPFFPDDAFYRGFFLVHSFVFSSSIDNLLNVLSLTINTCFVYALLLLFRFSVWISIIFHFYEREWAGNGTDSESVSMKVA